MMNYKDIKEFIFLPNLESEIYLSGKINIDLNKTYLPENLLVLLTLKNHKIEWKILKFFLFEYF